LVATNVVIIVSIMSEAFETKKSISINNSLNKIIHDYLNIYFCRPTCQRISKTESVRN